MDIIYYYYYLFYIRIVKDDEPYITTTWALSASEGFLTSVFLNIIFVKCFCYQMTKLMMFLPILFFFLFNYYYYYKSGRCKKIVKEKPSFFSNHKLSILITVLFFC